MPIVECGFGPAGPIGAAQLAQVGPTIRVNIGFDPALLAQIPGVGAVAANLTPAAQAGGTLTANPTLQPTLVQNVPALIDTGAGDSCIDEDLAQQLQLPLINQTDTVGC